MQTLLSSEEKNVLVRFFKDLGYLFDYELNIDKYSSEKELREAFLQADKTKLADSLTALYPKYRDIAEWMD